MLRGFSLIEVLIAAAILAAAILSIAALQFVALQRSQSAQFYSIATNQISQLLERYAAGDDNCTVWQAATLKLLPHATAKCNRATVSVCWIGRNSQSECVQQKI